MESRFIRFDIMGLLQYSHSSYTYHSDGDGILVQVQCKIEFILVTSTTKHEKPIALLFESTLEV